MPTTRIPYGVLDGRYVNAAGDTMLGELTLAGAPTLDLHAATKEYVDDAVGVGGHTHTLDAGATDVTATAAEVNLLDLSGLSIGQVLRAIGAASAAWGSIQAGDLPTGIDAAKIADGSVSNTEYQYLNGVTSAIQTQLDTKAADSIVLKKDGSVALTANWDIGDTRKIIADGIMARDAAGLELYDDGNNGIFIEDGGNVGIGTTEPGEKLHVDGSIQLDNGDLHIGAAPSGFEDYDLTVSGSNGGIILKRTIAADAFLQFMTSSGQSGQLRGMDGGGLRFITAWPDEGMRITNTCNVGIGTTGPDRKLDVLDSSNPQLRLTHTNESKFADFQVDTNGYLTVTPSGNEIVFSGDISGSGGFKQPFSFMQSDVAASQSAVALAVLGLAGNTEIVMPFAGSVIGISVASNDARTAGTLTVDATVYGQSRIWRGMAAAPNGNIYAAVYGGDIYMQTAGAGDFAALGQTSRNWVGIAAAPNGNIYAAVYGGDIYMQTAGAGDFAALGQTSRSWVGMAADANGNIYASVYDGDIYMQTAGSGNFVALGSVTGLQAVLDATNTQYHSATQAKDTDAFSAGNRIGVKITTDSSWAPTTADIVVAVIVEM